MSRMMPAHKPIFITAILTYNIHQFVTIYPINIFKQNETD